MTSFFFFGFSFSDLSLSGLKLSKPVIDGLCQLAKTSSLSRLMLKGTGIGNVSEFFVIIYLVTCIIRNFEHINILLLLLMSTFDMIFRKGHYNYLNHCPLQLRSL